MKASILLMAIACSTAAAADKTTCAAYAEIGEFYHAADRLVGLGARPEVDTLVALNVKVHELQKKEVLSRGWVAERRYEYGRRLFKSEGCFALLQPQPARF